MSLGNAFPVRSTIPDLVQVLGVWTGAGGTANCTKAAADWNKGIASVNYNAATGKYLVTFVDVGQQIVFGAAVVAGQTGVVAKVVNVLRSTFSASAKTVQIEVFTPATDVAAAALVALATTDKVQFSFVFAKNAPGA